MPIKRITLTYLILKNNWNNVIAFFVCLKIRRHMLELLLTYNCNYLDQFNGRSAIDVAMTKRADIFDIFIKHPKVDLNATINQSNQSILTKMFTLSYFVTLESKQRLEIVSASRSVYI